MRTVEIAVTWSSRVRLEVPDDWELPTLENELEASELDRVYDSQRDAEIRDMRVVSDSSLMQDLTAFFPR